MLKKKKINQSQQINVIGMGIDGLRIFSRLKDANGEPLGNIHPY